MNPSKNDLEKRYLENYQKNLREMKELDAVLKAVSEKHGMQYTENEREDVGRNLRWVRHEKSLPYDLQCGWGISGIRLEGGYFIGGHVSYDDLKMNRYFKSIIFAQDANPPLLPLVEKNIEDWIAQINAIKPETLESKGKLKSPIPGLSPKLGLRVTNFFNELLGYKRDKSGRWTGPDNKK